MAETIIEPGIITPHLRPWNYPECKCTTPGCRINTCSITGKCAWCAVQERAAQLIKRGDVDNPIFFMPGRKSRRMGATC